MAAIEEKQLGGIAAIEKLETSYSVRYKTGEYATLSILNNHVFRYYMSPTGQFLEYPTPVDDSEIAKINIKAVADYGSHAFDHSTLIKDEYNYIVETSKLKILFSEVTGTLTVYDKRSDKQVLKEYEPIRYSDSRSKQILHQCQNEHFFGGGMQNGRFTHKGESILIDYNGNWADGCNTCPKPFYWSTKGYGVMRNTWKTGCYDFGSKNQQIIELDHEEDYFDAYYFINIIPKDILKDYYELTGRPIFMPEYAFYEAHINTFNEIYWYETGPGAGRELHCDDDRYYEPHRTPIIHGKNGILGSLNGEKTKYEFSARFMIDWYNEQDMPLGWFVPNHESGYGQTDSLEGDLENLKKFVEYANDKGVEVALWSNRCLEPKDTKPEKGERDLCKEVDVGVVAFECHEVNTNYGLETVEKATKLLVRTSQKKIRPFIIMADGWAGTQRYAGVWNGEQTGGIWEYIRFHIPTLIGAGLSGLPVVCSVMDGAYGGGDIEVNIREFQWKTFTPLQLNMDVWGRTDKNPFGFNCIELIILNRASLKLKSMLQPYNYTICRESIHGLPMVRAMFLEFPKEWSAYVKDSQYQFMWGPSLLVAPVYANPDVNCKPVFVNSSSFYWAHNDFYYTKPKYENTPVRNEVYLPDPQQVWIDLFTGVKYQGGKIYNNIKTPIWKIPVFVKGGAIIPLVNPNNKPCEINRDCRIFLLYLNGASTFTVYEDDGKSSEYLEQKFANTTIQADGPASNKSGNVSIYIHKTIGSYKDMVKERSTVLQIMASENIGSIKAFMNNKDINLQRVESEDEFKNNNNVFYFDQKFIINPYLEVFGTDELHQGCLRIKIEKADVTDSEINIKIEEFSNKGITFGSNLIVNDNIDAPIISSPIDKDITATSVTLRWEVNDALYYEIERDSNAVFSNIYGDKYTFKNFDYESKHVFRIRSVSDAGVSKWSHNFHSETKPDPYKDTVKEVRVTSSVPCEHLLEVCNLTKADRTFWHTDCEWGNWALLDEGIQKISLSFDIDHVHDISKIKYVPREDAGSGTLLKIQYKHSMDGQSWSEMSPVISWDCDDSTKVIDMGDGVKFKHFELEILDSVLRSGSGRNFLFYKTNKDLLIAE